MLKQYIFDVLSAVVKVSFDDCMFFRSFMLSILSKQINKNHIGLYRGDGLAILKNNSGPELDKLKKKFQKLFKEKDLNIIV